MKSDVSEARITPAGFLREESALLIGLATVAAFQFGGDAWLVDLADPIVGALLFLWLFGAVLWASFGVVRHADTLAELLGEPYGTLILTVSVIGIEVSLIVAVMLSGDSAPTLARDTMFAVLMIVLNGLVGAALLFGGLRHSTQDYNLEGARAFLAVLFPLATLALVLPRFTVSTPDPTYAPLQAAFFAISTTLMYLVFLGIQTIRHRAFFEQPARPDDNPGRVAEHSVDHGSHRPIRSGPYHAILLILTLLPIILLSKRVAKLVNFGIVGIGAPAALGGVLIALLILTPESMAAVKAARANRLQRSVNLLLGSALASIGMTVPAVLAIGLIIDEPVPLGLDDASIVMLFLTLFTSAMTFGGTRTSVLQGAVHLVLFLVYVILIFNP
ncbi:calcium:proton antiporter [Ruegeria sediminis]|uniref:Calcium:proton antiporter n=1 Tax=Ruegeria sediminis TaxID=2583820 RepID=A0ABY2WWG3_9RHOB|nr:calcium:proton antiporter [Ruegeria sediminis]TMV06787.1 calcium:proton antiporter [Ruegeria sediminis]